MCLFFAERASASCMVRRPSPLFLSPPLSRFHRTKAKANICLRQDSIDCSGSRCRSMSYVSMEGGSRGPPVLSIMKASLIERGKEKAGLAKWRPRPRDADTNVVGAFCAPCPFPSLGWLRNTRPSCQCDKWVRFLTPSPSPEKCSARESGPRALVPRVLLR